MHLDPVGGVAGDMFAAALLDAFPAHACDAAAAAERVSGVACRLVPHRDDVLGGSRFDVAEPPHSHHHHHTTGHTTWREIRVRIAEAGLPCRVRDRAIGIFGQLASAEARVHGIDEERVAFHEIGAADSIADIVAAAWLIEAIGPARWSVGALPLGAGTVRTAHGVMPVPAPATALLLEGFAVVDDGIGGERVTPTGAAILRHLGCESRTGFSGRILATGHGFGTRGLPGRSNVLRAIAFAAAEPASEGLHRALDVIAYEVDDQSGEDLALGLDRLRVVEGVHDVVQMPAFGKKGRMVSHVQVLVRPDALEAAIEACFQETTTIGLRVHRVSGRALPREVRSVGVAARTIRVKSVARPGGRTSKAEAEDVRATPGHAARARLRREAERLADEPADD